MGRPIVDSSDSGGVCCTLPQNIGECVAVGGPDWLTGAGDVMGGAGCGVDDPDFRTGWGGVMGMRARDGGLGEGGARGEAGGGGGVGDQPKIEEKKKRHHKQTNKQIKGHTRSHFCWFVFRFFVFRLSGTGQRDLNT